MPSSHALLNVPLSPAGSPSGVWPSVAYLRARSQCEPCPPIAPAAYAFDFVDAGQLWVWTPPDACLGVIRGEYSLRLPDEECDRSLDDGACALTIMLPAGVVHEVARDFHARRPAGLQPAIRPADGQLLAILRAIALELQRPALGTALMLQSLQLQLSIHLLRDQQNLAEPERLRGSPRLLPEIRRAVEYIHAHLAEDVSLDQLAAAAALSRYHFVRRFRQQTGLTPHAYVQRLRLHQAAALLRSSTDTVAAIAAQLGFANPAHLASAFRQAYGQSPTHYRASKQ